MEDDRFVLRSVTDELMYELMELSGQEYVDVYASRAKAPRPASTPVGGRRRPRRRPRRLTTTLPGLAGRS